MNAPHRAGVVLLKLSSLACLWLATSVTLAAPAAPADVSDATLLAIEKGLECDAKQSAVECKSVRLFRTEGTPLTDKAHGRWLALHRSHDGFVGRAGPALLSVVPAAQRKPGEGPADHTGDVLAVTPIVFDYGDPDTFTMYVELSPYLARNAQIPNGNTIVKSAREQPVPPADYRPLVTAGKSGVFTLDGTTTYIRMTSWGMAAVSLGDGARPGTKAASVVFTTWPWGKTAQVGGDTDTSVVRPRKTPTVEQLVALCDGGNAGGCYAAGRKEQDARDRPREERIPRAIALFDRGCTGGHENACVQAAVETREWPGKQAFLERGCALVPHGEACEALGSGLLKTGVPADVDRGFMLASALCERPDGKGRGCYSLVQYLSTADIAVAGPYLSERCEKGRSEMCETLGTRKIRDAGGDAAARSDGIGLLGRACKAGRESACMTLDGKYSDTPEARDAWTVYLAALEKRCVDRPHWSNCNVAIMAYSGKWKSAKADPAKEGKLRELTCALPNADVANCKRACELTKNPASCKRFSK